MQKPKFGLGRLTVEVSRSQTHTHTHKLVRTPLSELSARYRGRYLQKAEQTQGTNIHAVSGIRTRDVSNEAAADLRLKPHGHRDRQQDVPEYNDNEGVPIAQRI